MRDDLKKLLLKALKDGNMIEGGTLEFPFPEFLFGDDEEQKTPIGIVSQELQKKFKKLAKEADTLQEELQLFVKQLELEAEKKIELKFGDIREELDERRKLMWNEIKDELGIPRDTSVSIDIRTGMISGVLNKPNLSIVKDFKSPKDNNIH
jgi:hypothetical protein